MGKFDFLVILLCLAILGAIWYQKQNHLSVNDQVPELVFADPKAKPFKDYPKYKIILWASWCAPCIEKMSLIKGRALAVNIWDRLEGYERVASKFSAENLVFIFDSDRKLENLFQVNAIPRTYWVENGIVTKIQ